MAQKGKRPQIMLVCEKCKNRNYYTERNVINTPEKLALTKFCKNCRIKTLHKEAKLPPSKKR